jgi:Replication-relaxation
MTARYLTTAAMRALTTKLTDHDLDVLKHVSTLRFLTGSQLTRLCFADTTDPATNGRAARRGLLRLARLGVLERLPRSIGGVRSGSAGYVYRLGAAGQRLAIAHGWQPEWRRRRSLVPGSPFLLHTLQVAELHTRLIESERSRRFELLELHAEPSCWRSYDGLGMQASVLKPDSFVRVGVGLYEDSFFIEVDRGTEGSRALDRQLAAYISYHASGQEQAERGVYPKTLWLTNTPERVTVIETSVQRLPGDSRELFQVAQFEDALSCMLGEKQ